MNIWKSMEGMVKAELTAAEPEKTLKVILDHGIRLYQIQHKDELTVWFQCTHKDRNAIRKICQKRGDRISFTAETGIFRLFSDFVHRPVLACSLAFLFFLTVFLPGRVLFFQVEGNVRIPERQILEAAQQCGIRFGISRRNVRSEQMKNALLSAMPELQWAGINTVGCTGIISVRERQPELKRTASTGIRHIVAARDGHITDCTVVRGSAMCAPGQVVQEGQILISGYADYGICLRICEASGEIYAKTNRRFHGCMPVRTEIRQEVRQTKTRYSLILGKKRINLWKGSGISTVTCGRMYEEYYITLPGGHRLPIGLSADRVTDAAVSPGAHSEEEMTEQLKGFARSYVLDQTIAGTILGETHQISQEDGRFELDSSFSCHEMIGRGIMEEIGETNGKTG